MSRLVFVHPQRFTLAHLIADSIVSKFDDDRNRDLWVAGMMCEQAVLTYFKSKQVLYKPSINGPDDGDIQIKLKNGMWITADVKLNMTSKSDALLVPQKQAIKRPYHIYIAARYVHEQQVEILGYCHAEDLEFIEGSVYQKHYASLSIDYDDLLDIQFLMERIEDGHPLEQYPVEIEELYTEATTVIMDHK